MEPHVDISLSSEEVSSYSFTLSEPWGSVATTIPSPFNITTDTTDTGNVTSSSLAYCEPLLEFRKVYLPVHGYVSLLVCTFGSVANALNIAVLTRPEMASPTNSILTGLAVADLLVMLEYIPYALYLSPIGRSRPFEERFSYPWALFVLFHANFTQVCHTVSIWLTVTLAVWRYIAVAHPHRNREWCGRERTLIAIGAAYVMSPLLCITLYLSQTIYRDVAHFEANNTKEERVKLEDLDSNKTYRNVTYYHVNMSKQGKTMVDINFWTYSVVIKLFPCVALTALSLRLVCALLEAKRRHETLSNRGAPRLPNTVRRPTEKHRQTDRTTRMLLAVLLLFLATELPQGLLGLLSGLHGPDFFTQCYSRLGELMDFLALLNSAINFILYCSMSRQFRTTFSDMFLPRFFTHWAPLPQGPPPPASEHNGHTGNHVTQV